MPASPQGPSGSNTPERPTATATRLGDVLVIALVSVIIGLGATGIGTYLCLQSVIDRQIDVQKPDLAVDEVGPLPIVGTLHVRNGVYWLVASDRLPGVWWVHIERFRQPSTDLNLDLPSIPTWAEPPASMRVATLPGPAAVIGTLAVGWPWVAVAQQWVEVERAEGFIPLLENDDDGSTTARAAQRFGTPTPAGGKPFLLWRGFLADTALFAAMAAPVIALVRRYGRAAGRRSNATAELSRPAGAA